MMNYQVEHDFLKWLFKGVEDNFSSGEYIARRYDDIIEAHRLNALLFHKISQCGQQSFSDGFVVKVNDNYNNLYKDVNRRIQLLQKLNKSILEDGFTHLPIILKGLSSYILTNNTRMIQRSSDIDIIYDNLSYLKDKFLALGAMESGFSCDTHEYCILKIEDYYIEIHNSFPIMSMESSTMRYIDYSFLAENAIDCNGIWLCNLEMSIVITSLHMYKNFYWESYRFPRVRLNELYQIYSLSKSDKFDNAKLLTIVKELNINEVLNFISTLLNEFYLGDSDISLFRKIVISDIKMLNGFCGSSLKINDERYLYNLPFINFKEVVDLMNPNNILNNTLYATNAINPIRYSEIGAQINYSFSVNFQNNNCVITFYINEPLEHYDNIFIHLGETFALLMFKRVDENWIEKRIGFEKGTHCDVQKDNESMKAIFSFNNISFENGNYMLISYEHNKNGKKTQAIVPIVLTSGF